MSLGKNIQALRKAKHMTQSELAEKLMVSRQAVSKWESDFNEPDIKTLIALSQIFQVSIDELVKEQNNEEEKEEEIYFENDEIDEQQITSEILKTNKKNHRLLMFITSFIICIIVIILCCCFVSGLFSESEGNEFDVDSELVSADEEGSSQNISLLVELDRVLIDSLNFDIELVSYEKQKINFKGELKTYSPMKEGTLTVVYRDQTKEKLDIHPMIPDKTYGFQKEIDAKNIGKIIIEIDGKKAEYSNIKCPIENYMYEQHFQTILEESQDNKSFQIKLSPIFMRDEKPFSFEDVIIVGSGSIQDELKIEKIAPIKLTLRKNNQVIKEMTINNEKQMKQPILVEEMFDVYANYDLELTYQTPFKQPLKWTHHITENDNEQFYE